MSPHAGPLLDREREEAADLLAYAFPDDPTLVERTRTTPTERTFAVREAGRLASVVLWREDIVGHHGHSVPICIAGPGATHPRSRRQGGLAGAQEAFLAAMRDAGCVLSGLETPITRWHRRNGWGVASAVRRYTGAPAEFRPLGGHAAGEADFDRDPFAEAELRQRAAGARFGFLGGHRAPASGLHRDELRRDIVLWREDGKATGYLRYSQRRGSEGHGADIRVQELYTVTPCAYLGLLDVLAEHNNIDHVVWDAPMDDPLHQVVAEPRSVEPLVCVDKMLRVVNLEALTVPSSDGSVHASGLVIELQDPQATWNSGFWEIIAGDGAFRFGRIDGGADRAAVHVRVDALGPIISGHLSAEAASRAGLVRAPDGNALRKLDSLRDGWAAPFCPDTW